MNDIVRTKKTECVNTPTGTGAIADQASWWVVALCTGVSQTQSDPVYSLQSTTQKAHQFLLSR